MKFYDQKNGRWIEYPHLNDTNLIRHPDEKGNKTLRFPDGTVTILNYPWLTLTESYELYKTDEYCWAGILDNMYIRNGVIDVKKPATSGHYPLMKKAIKNVFSRYPFLSVPSRNFEVLAKAISSEMHRLIQEIKKTHPPYVTYKVEYSFHRCGYSPYAPYVVTRQYDSETWVEYISIPRTDTESNWDSLRAFFQHQIHTLYPDVEIRVGNFKRIN